MVCFLSSIYPLGVHCFLRDASLAEFDFFFKSSYVESERFCSCWYWLFLLLFFVMMVMVMGGMVMEVFMMVLSFFFFLSCPFLLFPIFINTCSVRSFQTALSLPILENKWKTSQGYCFLRKLRSQRTTILNSKALKPAPTFISVHLR